MATEAPVDVLTPEQRETIGTMLSSPLKFPSEFKQWLNDWLAGNIPPIPVSQLLGYKPTLAHNAIVNTAEAITSPERTWTPGQSAEGPTVSGLADGTYFAAWGCKTGRGSVGGATTRMGPSVNGADPSGVNYCTFQATDPDAMVWKAAMLNVRNGTDNNTIECLYWVDLGGGASGQFEHRWLTAMRVT